jgi:hypothetical protein
VEQNQGFMKFSQKSKPLQSQRFDHALPDLLLSGRKGSKARRLLKNVYRRTAKRF